MFTNQILNTPLTSFENEQCLNQIGSTSYYGDISFSATLKALVFPRMKETDTLSLDFYDKTAFYSTSSAFEEIMRTVVLEKTNRILVYNLNFSNYQEAFSYIADLNNKFILSNFGWERIQKVSDFFKKDFEVSCFVNRSLRSTIIFVANMTLQIMHYLQCATLAFFPWYFNPSDGILPIERELIESLREKTPDKYMKCISKIAEGYDFRFLKIKRLLHDFESRYEDSKILELSQINEEIRRDIETYRLSISKLWRQKNENDLKLSGLKLKRSEKSDEESEIMNYFLNNENIILNSADGDTLNFSVKSYVSYYDRDAAESIINNERSYLYRNAGSKISAENMKMLLNAIFIEETLKLRFCASYEITISSASVYPLSDYSFDSSFLNFMPNPHIDTWNCMGDYESLVDELLRDNNYIGALEQCIASCKSLNFGDSCVMESFMRTMYNDENCKCIELPTGESVTVTDAISWLNKQEEEHE